MISKVSSFQELFGGGEGEGGERVGERGGGGRGRGEGNWCVILTHCTHTREVWQGSLNLVHVQRIVLPYTAWMQHTGWLPRHSIQ